MGGSVQNSYGVYIWPLSDNGRVLGDDRLVASVGFAGIEQRKLRLDEIGIAEAA
jgi:hypothetical protein